MERHLRQSGDNLENPYVLPLSFTGTAAANIDGMTLHSAFNFPFSNEFLSLPDKLREKNLKRIMVRDGICGESANGLKNGNGRFGLVRLVGQKIVVGISN